MSEELKRSIIEVLKENSRQLRGTLAEELLTDHEFCAEFYLNNCCRAARHLSTG